MFRAALLGFSVLLVAPSAASAANKTSPGR